MVWLVLTLGLFGLTVKKVQLRVYACLSNLKQSGSKFYKEQKLFYDQLMKICTTCSKWSHKSDFGLGSTLRNFLSTKTEFSVSWARLWPDFTLCPLRIRLWSLNEFCSWYLGLQLVSWLFLMLTNGLGVMDRWKHTFRPVVCSAVWTESLLQCRPFQCFTAACMLHVAGRLTA